MLGTSIEKGKEKKVHSASRIKSYTQWDSMCLGDKHMRELKQHHSLCIFTSSFYTLVRSKPRLRSATSPKTRKKGGSILERWNSTHFRGIAVLQGCLAVLPPILIVCRDSISIYSGKLVQSRNKIPRIPLNFTQTLTFVLVSTQLISLPLIFHQETCILCKFTFQWVFRFKKKNWGNSMESHLLFKVQM